ncbi:hypothetical protein FS749_004659 [Ceratobasidium sp. UAMH 11750]|nr:hypothetical protein FS749_004659 [Ceratobasidium sp. UAMH 11750]
MSSGKRQRPAPQPQPISLNSSGSKRVKFNSAQFSGSRSQFTLRPAQSSARDLSKDSKAPDPVHLNRGDFYQEPLETWSAEQIEADPGFVDEPDTDFVNLATEHDMEDVILSASMSRSGKGQNEMLNSWMENHGTSYLQRLFNQYQPPGADYSCACGHVPARLFKCRDCLGGQYQCQTCIVHVHARSPTHRIREWSKDQLVPVTLQDLGCKLALGNHHDACPAGSTRELLLGSLDGFHRINVVFCRCERVAKSQADYQQLLDARIFPCSDDRPTSAFTFNTLRVFHFAATEGKMSGGRFYSLLSRLTNSTLPGKVDDRYREFMRTARQWMLLQTKKRAGVRDIRSTENIAIRCPACPRAGINVQQGDVNSSNQHLYTTHISYDGSFQLVRRQRAQDDYDICLTGGQLYFVESAPYEEYLSQLKDDGFKNAKVSDCNNHKAATGAWTLYEGLAVTGVGACSCARHAFYMPKGVVNYFKGERFAYTDYAIGGVMELLQLEGCDNIGFYYDIYCHWSKNWWARAARLPMQIAQPARYTGGIPKYHLAGHTDSCYIQYSLNNMHGVGRLDAEGCERLWADANQAAGSTSNKGSGACMDSLNHLFQDWNWRKATTIALLLVRKLNDALKASAEKRTQWQEFHECIDPALTSAWLQLNTAPYKVNGKWRSVYMLKDEKVMSVTKSLQALRELEAESASSSTRSSSPFSAADWLAEGFEIEMQQQRLRQDIKTYGSSPTPHQALDIGRRRQALQQRMMRHCHDASLFYTPEQLGLYVLVGSSSKSQDNAGRPELMALVLPSRLPTFCRCASTEADKSLIELERMLRRAGCLQALARVRTTSQQKALLLKQKQKHVRGEVQSTRVQGMISRLTARVDLAVWEYTNSRTALFALGASEEDEARLKRLTTQDLSGLTSMLQADRSTGEGQRQLPWFWAVRSMKAGEYDESHGENDEAMKVEWFRGKARYERWEEEVMILRREMASVVLSFNHEAENWIQRQATVEATFAPGYRAFCTQQATMWQSLRDDSIRQFRDALQESAGLNKTCKRAADNFL